jgi:hypothetical protein
METNLEKREHIKRGSYCLNENAIFKNMKRGLALKASCAVRFEHLLRYTGLEPRQILYVAKGNKKETFLNEVNRNWMSAGVYFFTADPLATNRARDLFIAASIYQENMDLKKQNSILRSAVQHTEKRIIELLKQTNSIRLASIQTEHESEKLAQAHRVNAVLLRQNIQLWQKIRSSF